MLLMGLNIGLVASSMVSLWISYSIPGILAITCGIVGGVTLYSRVIAWKTGTVKHLYDLVRDSEKAKKKMRNFDTMFSATAVFNSGVFLGYLANLIAGNVQSS